MPKQKVILSAEELRLRRLKKEQGIPVVTESEVLTLRNKVVALENQLAKRQESLAERGPCPATLRAKLDTLLEHYNVEPAEQVIKILMEKDDSGQFVLGPKDRAELWMDLNQYRMAKLKAVELSGKVDQSITYNVIMFSKDPHGGAPREELLETKTIDIKKEPGE